MGTALWVALTVGALGIGFLLGVCYAAWLAEKTVKRIERGFAALMEGQAQAMRSLLAKAQGGEETPAP